MKILNLKIISPNGEVKRDINFEKCGISYVYGDILENKNKNKTINSLGKTLLLEIINYIFGSNLDSKIFKEEIKDYTIESKILFKNKILNVKRSLGDSKYIILENDEYNLESYKDKLSISRELYTKQIILEKKMNVVSYQKSPNKSDILSCLKLLNLDDIYNVTNDIYSLQDEIGSIKKNIKELTNNYIKLPDKEVKKEIFFLDQEVEKISKELLELEDKIKLADIGKYNKDTIEKYSKIDKQINELEIENEADMREISRLKQFIDESENADVKVENLIKIFNKANQEVPEMVKKNLKDLESFNKKVYEERKNFLIEKEDQIKEKIEIRNNQLIKLYKELKELGEVIASNEVYQKSLKLYTNLSNELQEKKYRQGELSQIKNMEKDIKSLNFQLNEQFIKLSELFEKEENKQKIEEYRIFINEVTKRIYDNTVSSFFDIVSREKHQSRRPISFEINLRGDGGDGINEVKNVLFDILLFKYSTNSEIFIVDSVCFNGVDPRQVIGLLNIIEEISIENKKQTIISINKYQLGEYEEAKEDILDKSKIILSENSKLLYFDF